jgi:tetratricopeptide (TPR) repeat protein
MVLILEPYRFEHWADKGLALRELKQYNDAIPYYERALELNPDLPPTINQWSIDIHDFEGIVKEHMADCKSGIITLKWMRK